MAGPNQPIVEHYVASIPSDAWKLSGAMTERVSALLDVMFRWGFTNTSLPLGEDEKYPVWDGEAPGIGIQHMMTLGLLDKSK